MEAGGNAVESLAVGAELKSDKPMAHVDTALGSGTGAGFAGYGGFLEEECDPDMIGFEIVTG